MQEKKSGYKFTVIIPTRERADTLESALKTCTEQDYENLEIIVSDNFSQDRTREVVEANKDPRIRYVNTGKRISMTANYEFSLSHATGDYVGLIGDDDGLMPNAIRELNDLMQGKDVEAISWTLPTYAWDNWYDEASKNTLEIPFTNKLEKFDSSAALQELLTFKSNRSIISYFDLPCVYHGFVRSDVIENLRSRNGRFFNSIIPDVYSSITIACVTKSFWFSAVPYSINGSSSHSIGAQYGSDTALKTFLTEGDIAPHPDLKIVPRSGMICTAEVFFQARDIVEEAKQFNFNEKGFFIGAMEEAARSSEETYQSIANSLRHYGEIHGLQVLVEAEIAAHPIKPPQGPFSHGYNFLSKYLIVELNSAKIKDVYDATVECKKIMNERSGLYYFIEANRFLINSFKSYGLAKFSNRVINHFSRRIKNA